MKHLRIFLTGLTGLVCGAAMASDLSSYTVTFTMEILKPISAPAELTNDTQSVRMISETDRTATVEIRVYPFADQLSGLQPNPNWRSDNALDARLQKYLKPGLTTNWDDHLRTQLLQTLRADGIDPDKLDDVALVRAVSAWIFSRFHFIDHFVSFDVNFDDGGVTVDPQLQEAFENEKKKNGLTSDQDALLKGIFGKSMFDARIYGNCTMSATLQATILKALGIPTRIIGHVPTLDNGDPAQIEQFKMAIHHNALREQVLHRMKSFGGAWVNHTFNEVFVGKRWVRLNYSTLGQTPFWEPMGLMVEVFQMADWSESRLTAWAKQAYGIERPFHPSSANTYRLLQIKDDPSMLNETNNPPHEASLYKTVRLLKFRGTEEAEGLPPAIASELRSLNGLGFFVTVDLGGVRFDYQEIKKFVEQASPDFILKSPGHPDVPMKFAGSMSGYGDDGLLLVAAPTILPGVTYSIQPLIGQGKYHWEVEDTVTVMGKRRPSADPSTTDCEFQLLESGR